MTQGIVCLLLSSIALAQAPKLAPVDAILQDLHKARNEGRWEEVVAKREEARALLERMPADTPQFASWVRQVGSLYENSAMSAQARSMVQSALERTDALGEASHARIQILSYMAELWQQDRNLLKALSYWEKAVAAADKTPPASTMDSGTSGRVINRANMVPASRVYVMSGRMSNAGENSFLYDRLLDLYMRLGRKESAEALLHKMRSRPGANDATLANWYVRQGEFEEAAKVYKAEAERLLADSKSQPWEVTGPLQSITNLYVQDQKYEEAASALQQAVALLSSKPDASNHTIGLRQQLAGILGQAGRPQAADEVYQQLLSETKAGQGHMYRSVALSYANYLARSNRGAEAEAMLKGMLEASTNPQEQVSALYSLANVARVAGQNERAEEYQRAAREKQPAPQPPQPERNTIGNLLQKAQVAAKDRPEDAFGLALQAMDAASRAMDRDQVMWLVPSIASQLASRKLTEKADQLFQRLFTLVESWSGETLQPLLVTQQQYVHFLTQQKERWPEVPRNIERYGDLITSAHGTGSGRREDILRATANFERARGSQAGALRAAQEVVALAESLAGTLSEQHLAATEMLAEQYAWIGDRGRETSARLQAIAIADAVLPANDIRRGYIRRDAALALAHERRFDEAERLMQETIALAQRMFRGHGNEFTGALEQIRRMKKD